MMGTVQQFVCSGRRCLELVLNFTGRHQPKVTNAWRLGHPGLSKACPLAWQLRWATPAESNECLTSRAPRPVQGVPLGLTVLVTTLLNRATASLQWSQPCCTYSNCIALDYDLAMNNDSRVVYLANLLYLAATLLY